MVTLVPHRVYTIAQYVQLEKFSNVKHEFFAGQIWPMSGGTPDHSAYAVNIATASSAQLASKKCRVYNSDARVRVQRRDL
jgi:Uma2 family endonuclease